MALIITGIAIGALTITARAHWDTSIYMREQTFAHWVAMNQAAELQLQKVAPELGSQKNQTDMLNTSWSIDTITTTTPNEYVRRIDIEVFQPNDPSGEPLAIVSLFLPTLDPSNLATSLQANAQANSGNAP